MSASLYPRQAQAKLKATTQKDEKQNSQLCCRFHLHQILRTAVKRNHERLFRHLAHLGRHLRRVECVLGRDRVHFLYPARLDLGGVLPGGDEMGI